MRTSILLMTCMPQSRWSWRSHSTASLSLTRPQLTIRSNGSRPAARPSSIRPCAIPRGLRDGARSVGFSPGRGRGPRTPAKIPGLPRCKGVSAHPCRNRVRHRHGDCAADHTFGEREPTVGARCPAGGICNLASAQPVRRAGGPDRRPACRSPRVLVCGPSRD